MNRQKIWRKKIIIKTNLTIEIIAILMNIHHIITTILQTITRKKINMIIIKKIRNIITNITITKTKFTINEYSHV